MTATPTAVSSKAPTELAYQPALDGVRAIAVALVLVFHLGVPWMRAGYLGVSVFFTLSGFLITSLLLRELDDTGVVSYRRFYARRARRLLPAGLACLLAIVVLRAFGEFRLVPDLRADLLAALAQVFNWAQIAGDTSYATLFAGAASTSPVEHYWSLSIEEQFYLVWPAAFVGIYAWSRRRRRNVVAPLAVVTVVACAAGPVIGWRFGPDVAYWSTVGRLGELLVGALAAVWVLRRPPLPAWVRWLAIGGAALVVVAAVTLPRESGPAFNGWLSPFAVATAALLVGLQVPGPMRTALSVRPLVWVGTVSYGLYLVHWPVFVLLRQHGWDLDTWAGAAVALSLTFAVTVLSYRALERPIRRAPWTPPRTAGFAAMAMAITAGAVLVVAPARSFLQGDPDVLARAAIDESPPAVSLAARPAPSAAPGAASGLNTKGSAATVPKTSDSSTIGPHATEMTTKFADTPEPAVPTRPVRILLVGDSTTFALGQGLGAWAVEHPDLAQIDIVWCEACGYLVDGTVTSFDAAPFLEHSRDLVERQVPERVAALVPDIVVLASPIVDVADRAWDGGGTSTPYDAEFREHLRAQYAHLTDDLVAAGVPTVVWLDTPAPATDFPTDDLDDDARYPLQRTIVGQVVGAARGMVLLCDLAGWFSAHGHDGDAGWRPDGTHLTTFAAHQVAADWLGPWLVAAALGTTAG